MTKEQLDNIRKNVDFNDVSIHDVIPLLEEVRKLTAERDEALKLAYIDIEHCFPDLTWKSRLEETLKDRNEVRRMLEFICGEFARTVAHADWVAAGSKGMSVPFHGDFASVAHLPSVISRMRWWVREMRRVLGERISYD